MSHFVFKLILFNLHNRINIDILPACGKVAHGLGIIESILE